MAQWYGTSGSAFQRALLIYSRAGPKTYIQYLVSGYNAPHIYPLGSLSVFRTGCLQDLAATSSRSLLLRYGEQNGY